MKTVLRGTDTTAETSMLNDKVDEVLQMLKAKQVQQYAFSQAKTGNDLAVAAALATLGLSGVVARELPETSGSPKLGVTWQGPTVLCAICSVE